MPSSVYDALNKAWNSTCRVLFGQETAPLSECREWLREYDQKLRTEKSSLSGKDVTFSLDDYSNNARFAAFNEIDFGKKFEPLSINDIKDMDSIIEAVQERAIYTGNVILGNSSQVQGSNNVIDSHFVLESTTITEAKYLAFCRYTSYSEYCFGLLGAEKDIHCVKCNGSELKRCFECHMGEVFSDCYYCAKGQNNRECMFSFGLENGAYSIGNTPLPREKYLQIKSKLLSEIAERIKKEKKVFSLLELIEKCSKYGTDARLKFSKEKPLKFDPSPVQKGFDKAASIIFSQELGPFWDYSAFLYKHTPKNVMLRSPLSRDETPACGYRAHLLSLYDLRKRIVTEEEIRSIGRNSGLANIEDLSLDIDKLTAAFHPIAYTNLDKAVGQNSNFTDAPVIIDSTDCCHGSAFVRSKRCSHSFWPSNDEAVFGSSATFESSYCMKCFYSKKLTRCFECDNCHSCADSYFLHNCENVRESMFCFNAKNLTNAVGNAPMKAEDYRRIKSSLISQMADELEKKKDLKWDIFNVGTRNL